MEDERKKKAEHMMRETRKGILRNLRGIRYKIAVMSGKGGVGKTTVAINIAASLSKDNRVSILDADVDCPNVNKFLGIRERFSAKGDRIIPVERFGMKIVSFASFQEREDQPIIWRGPLLSNALMQVLGQVEWGDLDYLIVDLPPGTSDAPLTIMQMLKPDGMVIVTNPQDVALTDARRSVNMARKMGVPVLGIIENMAGDVFGRGGAERAARDLGIPFLGRIELDAVISRSAERGEPLALERHKIAEDFRKITGEIIRNLENHGDGT